MADRPTSPLRGRSRGGSLVSGDGSKKAPPLIDEGWTFLAIDHFTKHVHTVQWRGWHPIGSNPTIDVLSSRKKVTVLKAVTHDGETLHFWTEENLTAAHGVRLLRALRAAFGERLVFLLDQGSYFYAKDLWEFVSGERSTECVDDTAVKCSKGETLQVWYFPAHLPELNPVEGCWKELNTWIEYRLIEDLSELKAVLTTALDEIQVPEIFNHLCPDIRPYEISKDF